MDSYVVAGVHGVSKLLASSRSGPLSLKSPCLPRPATCVAPVIPEVLYWFTVIVSFRPVSTVCDTDN